MPAVIADTLAAGVAGAALAACVAVAASDAAAPVAATSADDTGALPHAATNAAAMRIEVTRAARDAPRVACRMGGFPQVNAEAGA